MKKKKHIICMMFLALLMAIPAISLTGLSRVQAAAVLSKPSLKTIAATGKGLEITWGKVSGASGYYVYRKSGNSSYKKIDTVKKASTVSYVDEKVKSGTTYQYTVRAYKGSVKSSYNKTGLKMMYLSTPKVSLTAKDGYVKATWSASAGAKKYLVYRKLSGEKYVRIASVGSTDLSYSDKTAPGGGKYYYTVVAYNGSNKSAKTAKSCTLPKAPSTPKLGKVTAVQGGLKLTWNRSGNAEGYFVYRKTGSSGFSKVAAVKGASALSYTDKSVTMTTGKKYTYTVAAYGKGVRSGYNKTGVSYTVAYTISNTKSAYTIEADVTLSGTGTGYHAKLVACTPTSAVSFGIQYDQWAVAPYTGKTMFLVENVYSNAAGGQQYVRTGTAATNKKFHLMLAVLSDGTCNVYVDGAKVGSVKNPQLANQTIALRVEGSARKNGDSVKAVFSNIKLKGNGSYNSSQIWSTYNFDTNDGVKSNTSKFQSSKTITISGKIKNLTASQDWDNAYEKVSGIIQFF